MAVSHETGTVLRLRLIMCRNFDQLTVFWNVINILLALFLQIISFHFSRKHVKTWMRPRMKLWRKSSIIISCMTALLLMFSSITLWSVCSQSQTLHPGKDVWQKGIFSLIFTLQFAFSCKFFAGSSLMPTVSPWFGAANLG